MPRKPYDPNVRYSYATAYCPKCKVTCWYTPGQPHYQGCDGILIDIKEHENDRTDKTNT